MSSPSKKVTRQHELIAMMASAALRNSGDVAAGLNARFGPQAQSDEAAEIDWKSILDRLGRFFAEYGSVLVGKDEDLNLTRRRERQLRDRRNLVTKQVRNQLRGARFLLDQAFGPERTIGTFPARKELSSMTPTNLLRVAKEVVALLEGSGVDWPPVDVIGHAATPAQLLASLRQSVGVLESTLEELRPEKRGATFALGLRDKDLEGSLDALQRGSDFLFGLFRFAGFDFAAERLRPTRRRTKAAGEETPEGPQSVPEVAGLLSA